MLNKFPYGHGHLLVAPVRHVALPEDLADGEYEGLMHAVRRAARALRTTFTPEGMNIGMNLGSAAGAGVADHCHWHLLPRWNGDTNFMPVIGDVRVMSEISRDARARPRPLHVSDPAGALAAAVGAYRPGAVATVLHEATVDAPDAFDRIAFEMAFAAAGRSLGSAALGAGTTIADATEHTWSIAGWGLDEAGRVLLLLRGIGCLPPGEQPAWVDGLYRAGAMRERQAVLRALALLPEPARFLAIALDACRTSTQPVFEAIACENPIRRRISRKRASIRWRWPSSRGTPGTYPRSRRARTPTSPGWPPTTPTSAAPPPHGSNRPGEADRPMKLFDPHIP
jgi:diadenosine tetraphosphate (Ap4A) HIT family hydrolase